MKYPGKKQIEKKTQDLVRTMRNYIRGNTKAYAVKNEFRCLFTDLFLDAGGQAENAWIRLMKEW